jgi:hypothetical protein
LKTRCHPLNELDANPQFANDFTVFVERQGYCNQKRHSGKPRTVFSNFGAIQFKTFEQIEKLITKINFSHPLFKAVFENRITNFQYPKTNGSFTITNGILQII